MWRLTVICVVLIGTPGLAQKCLSHDDRTIQVHVRRVAIHSIQPLIKSHERQTVADIRRLGGDRSNDSWHDNLKDLAEEAEEIVKEAYQNDGYSKAEAQANVTIVRSGESHASVDILVTANPGEQYHLHEIRWTGMNRFTGEQLSALMPTRPGEIFNRRKVVDGIQALKTLYDSVGFINFTVFPNTEFDEAQKEISITMDIDEGDEFSLGSVFVSGFTRQQLDQLDKLVQPLRGELYTPAVREQVGSKVASLAPCREQPAVQMHVDERALTVSYFIDYSDCYDSWLESLDAAPDLPSK